LSENTQSIMDKLGEELPEVMRAFSALHEEALKEGALSVKTKRLIMLGASVAVRCEPCIRVHVNGALEEGASREEILEAASVGILMGGGPSAAYTALYLLDELGA
jgi:AhpD family alkylhydroperoxidase